MEDLVLVEFEDLIALQDEGATSQQPEPPEDEFDESQLKPMDATTLSAPELHQEVGNATPSPLHHQCCCEAWNAWGTQGSLSRGVQMERRQLQAKGFRADDERTLQEAFNREHQEYIERLKKERVENRERVLKQAAMQRRRMLMEKQLREEQDETAKDQRIEFWLSLVRRKLLSMSLHRRSSSRPYPLVALLQTADPPELDGGGGAYRCQSHHCAVCGQGPVGQ
jgi:hypothetical protein